MFAIRGQAQATATHARYHSGSIHSVVAIANSSSAEEAELQTRAELIAVGFGEIRLFEFTAVPLWRAFLPTEKGRLLRSGISKVVVNIFSEDDGKWCEPDA